MKLPIFVLLIALFLQVLPSFGQSSVEGFSVIEAFTINLPGSPSTFCFNGDGTRIGVTMVPIVEPYRSYWGVWDAETGALIDTTSWNLGFRYFPAAAFSPDGTVLSTGGGITGRIDHWVYGVESRNPEFQDSLLQPISISSSSSTNVLDLVYRTTGDTLQLYATTSETAVLVFDAGRGEELSRMNASGGQQWQLRLNSDSSELASTGSDWGVRIWDLEARAEERAVQFDSIVTSISWSPDSDQLLVVYGNYLSPDHWMEERSGTSGELVREFETEGVPVLEAFYSPNGKVVGGIGLDSMVYFWDARTGERVYSFRPYQGLTNRAQFTPNGQYLVTAGQDDYTLRFWNWEYSTTSVSEPVVGESNVRLLAPRPNPARESVEIPFMLAGRSSIRLSLMNLQGREVKALTEREYERGSHTLRVGVEDLVEGVYYVVLRTEREHLAQKLQVLR